nr:unnamed protein product [Callosobruchus chinensis]
MKGLCHIVEDNSSTILLTLPVTVASGQWNFSKLKLVRIYLTSSISETRLDDLAKISIEHELGEKLDYSDLVNDFAVARVRKMPF